MENIKSSFRPLIGVSFCKLLLEIQVMENIKSSFRPLIGVSFCKLLLEIQVMENIKSSFRPLIGVSFCKLKVSAWHLTYRITEVSVPLSGSVSVNI